MARDRAGGEVRKRKSAHAKNMKFKLAEKIFRMVRGEKKIYCARERGPHISNLCLAALGKKNMDAQTLPQNRVGTP